MRPFLPLIVLLSACPEPAPEFDLNRSPLATIDSPEDGAVLTECGTVAFEGTVSDFDDIASSLTYAWTVDGGAVCEDVVLRPGGELICPLELAAGDAPYVVSLSVTDPAGASSEDSISVEVAENGRPTVSMDRSGTETLVAGTAFELVLTPDDAEDVLADLTLALSSDVDGVLDITPTFDENGNAYVEVSLTEAEHTLTATVTDTCGGQGTATLTLTVIAAIQ